MDRRDAIKQACVYAKESADRMVIISGKGTDPYIMEAHGGQIWLESKTKKGTTVFISIPL